VENASGELVLAALMTPPHNLILHAAQQEGLGEAQTALADALQSAGRQVPGVNGPAQLSGAFARLWTQRTGQTPALAMHERVYELRRVTPPSQPPSGSMRLAQEAEIEFLADWSQAFEEEAIGAVRDWEDLLRRTRFRIEDGSLFVWENEGQPVSMTATTRPTRSGITIGLVYTPAAQRRRGYASALVAAVSQRMLDSGRQFCTLFTDLSNPTSNAIYQQIGYVPVGDFDEYRFAPAA
jgi:predicted GNAT family acetyltransferase